MYHKYDPMNNNPEGRKFADELLEGCRSKPYPDPKKKNNPMFRLYRVLGEMAEGHQNSNEHTTAIRTDSKADNSKEGAQAVLAAAKNMDTTLTFCVAKAADDDDAENGKLQKRRV